MNTLDFFRQVLPGTGNYCLFKLPQNEHVWFDDLVQMADFSDTHSAQQGWYFGVAAYDAAESRKAQHVTAAKSLWFDIDAGEEKHSKHGDKVYRTQAAALAHLHQFSAWLGVAPALTLSSGEGLHVYYSFKNEVSDLNLWMQLATLLRASALQFGLKIDAGVTTDRARILRALGTVHKNGTRVAVIEQGDLTKAGSLVAAFRQHGIRTENTAPAVARPSINADLDMPPPVFPKSSIDKIASRCKWTANMLAANGNTTEPEWRAMLGLIKHTVEGEARAHAWSSGAASYDHRETQRKLDGWKVGPVSCETVRNEHGCADCASCPQWGKVKSPIMLGALSASDKVAVPKAAAPASGFTAFVGDESDDEPAPAPEPAASGELVEFITGKMTAAEVLRECEQRCQRAALIRQGLLPEKFPKPAELFRHNPKHIFFVRKERGAIVLYVGHQIESDIAGEKSFRMSFAALTEQPFFLESHSHGAGGDSEVSVGYIYQYDHRSGSPVPVWNHAAMSTTELVDRNAFRKPLVRLGISFHDSSQIEMITNMLHQFSHANLSLLRKRESKLVAQHHMGFQFNRSTRAPMYVQGEYGVSTDGAVSPCTLGADTRSIADRFALPFLTIDELRQKAAHEDIYETSIKPAAQRYCEGVRAMYGAEDMSKYGLAWLLGVSSPYLTFVTDEAPDPAAAIMPAMGVALSLYSVESGVGKTSLQKVIVAAFAKPEENKANGNKETGMTPIALGANLCTLGSIPFMLDEVTNNDAETTSQLIHKISSGRDKVRATSAGKAVQRTGSWASVTTMSTNVSQRMLISQHREASIAEQMRVVEICFDGTKRGDMLQWIEEYNRSIMKNQGALGMALGRFAVKNWDAMRNLANAEFKRIQETYNIKNSERYFAKVFTAASLALSVMRRMGMNPVDSAVVEQEFRATLAEVRGYLRDTVYDDQGSAEDLVNYLQPRLLLTATEHDLRGKTLKPEYDLVHNPQIVAQRISGRYVASSKVLYITYSAARMWASKGGYDLKKLMGQWHKAGILIVREDLGEVFKKRLSIGIHESVMAPMVTRCFTFDMNALEDKIEILPDNVVPLNPQKASATASPSEEKHESANGQ